MNIKSFFKLYTLPILALLVGFGLYYIIFVGANDGDSFSILEGTNGAIVQNDKAESPHLQAFMSSGKTDEEATQNPIDKDLQGLPEPDTATNENNGNVANDMPNDTSDTSNNTSSVATQIYVVLPKTINIRQAPNTISNIVGKLSYNQKVAVEFVTEGWAKIKDGWVLVKLLKPEDEANGSEKNSDGNIYVVIPKSLNIRSEPDVSSKIVGKLIGGEAIKVESIQGDWAKVKNGWVLLNWLKKQDTY
ncbi:SH3 domain-containing protein [Helicobacter sp. 11S02596-1]|uniref:SH3 domain-containing protein n=1 Tax=Helicobacter sp. 11S02596-1 TaxID=1476194 RepID=UPI000BA651DA|nr:SH3 domain-containing protein [Helicobacter sp. 11S02596-1]PAF43131.1 hypothetical protein BJI48_05135 [Helicobacter sp. 11S02596-1]